MKVIEQLVQHFHARGVLTPRQIDDLIRHGYVRRQDLFTPDPDEDDDEPVEPTPLYDPVDENLDLLGEEMSEVADRRGGGRKKGGKDKAKPTGHDLAPLEAVLTAHLASRSRYPAMAELGRRLTAGTQGCPGVHD